MQEGKEKISEARPTEYDGVVFRSKSEAIMARNLDLTGFVWEYEPKKLSLQDGWRPDFWVVFPRKLTKSPTIIQVVMEYKPSKPTDTYIKELMRRFSDIDKKVSDDFFFGILACGNPFDDKQKKTVTAFETTTGRIVELDWNHLFFRNFDEARRYRFDLA